MDTATRELRRGDQAVSVQPKVFDLLVHLVKNAGRVVTRQELLDQVWGGVIVGDAALSRAVREVRRALADDGDSQRILKTLHARGFRFVAPIIREEGLPSVHPPTPSAPPPGLDDEEREAFVGRASELAVLEALVADVVAGNGHALAIHGEPGIGKTALLDRATAKARRRGVEVHVAQCTEADGVPALWPWEQLLRSIARSLRAAAPPPMREWAAIAAPLLGADVAPFGVEPSSAIPDTPEARFRLHEAVARLVVERARTRPTMLVIDDLHLADESTLALVAHVASRLRGTACALVVAHRESVRNDGLARAAAAIARSGAPGSLALRGLEGGAIAELVEKLTGERPSQGSAEALASRTGGNPLFLAQVVEQGGLEPTRTPRALEDVVASALSVLSPDAVEMLRVASIVGTEFRLVAVARALGRAPESLLDAIGDAVEYRIVRRVPERVDSFRFAHGLLRDALYEGMGLADRARGHAAVGDALRTVARGSSEDVQSLAHHYLRAVAAGRAADAVAYAERAGDHAVDRAAFSLAVDHYRAALDALPLAAADDGSLRARLLVRLGSALGRDGRLGEAGAAFQEASTDATGEPFLADVATLRQSFRAIVLRTPEVTERFYEVLFERHPQIRELFRRNEPALQVQMMKDTLLAIVDRLEDAPWLRRSLAALGAKHVEYGVVPAMYPLVGEALLWTLGEAAGPEVWTPHVAEAWARAFGAISTMMLVGARASIHPFAPVAASAS